MQINIANKHSFTRNRYCGTRRLILCSAAVLVFITTAQFVQGQTVPKCNLSVLAVEQRAACLLLGDTYSDRDIAELKRKAPTLLFLLNGTYRARDKYGPSGKGSGLPITSDLRTQIGKLLKRYQVDLSAYRLSQRAEYFVI